MAVSAAAQARQCTIFPLAVPDSSGQSGECRIPEESGRTAHRREVTRGPARCHVDPMEKKPLSTSFRTADSVRGHGGCNLHCSSAERRNLAGNPEDVPDYELQATRRRGAAKKHACLHLAYTYTEPWRATNTRSTAASRTRRRSGMCWSPRAHQRGAADARC
jgi:hypothetical protein